MRRITDVADIKDGYDVVIVGAGPAGLAAATELAGEGRSILLIDENAGPGGQIYRAIDASPALSRHVLGDDYWRGKQLVSALATAAIDYAPGSTLWHLGPGSQAEALEIGFMLARRSRMLAVRRCIIATGAIERPFPIPGWTLPGVMTVGAAQTALKSSAIVPEGPLVIAGTGPLLFLLCAQLLAAGVRLDAILDTTPRANWLKAMRYAPDFLRSRYLFKGLNLFRTVRSHVGFMAGVRQLRAIGGATVEAVRFVDRNGHEHEVPARTLLLHQGIIPHINLASAAGCALRWDAEQAAWTPQVDTEFASSVAGVSIVGDGAGIGGADVAMLRGRLGAMAISASLGWINDVEHRQLAMPVQRELRRAERGRRFLDRLYMPSDAHRIPGDNDVIVCRCEEVTLGEIRRTLAAGTHGINQLKTFLRCGMGPCQGRLCGPTITELIASYRSVSPADVGYYRLRSPVKPITLAQLACVPSNEDARGAVR